MPKLQESENQQKNRAFRAECMKQMELQRIKPMTIAKLWGVTIQTARKKLKDPGKQTVPELRAICKFLKFPDDVKLNIL